MAKIHSIPISQIVDFPDHPYRVLDDEDMNILKESIQERGLITPVTVRKTDENQYEMISGHRRKIIKAKAISISAWALSASV